MISVKFLGTNGWYDTEMGNTVSILIKSTEYNIVLDAGNGFAKIDYYLDQEKPVYLFLSHFHLDHIIGLHTLLLNKFSKGLIIFTQEGGTEILNALIKRPFTVPFQNLPYKTEILEVPRDCEKLPFKAEFLHMDHPVPTLGIRLELEDKIISYTADTAYCDNAIKLAANADLLIAESAFKPGEIVDNPPHLNPEEAAQIAKKAAAKKLVLMHFDARRYPDLQARVDAEKKAQETFEDAYYSTDGMEFIL